MSSSAANSNSVPVLGRANDLAGGPAFDPAAAGCMVSTGDAVALNMAAANGRDGHLVPASQAGQMLQSADDGAALRPTGGNGSAAAAIPSAAADPVRRSKRTVYDKLEAFISRLTSRSTLAHRLASLIWLPYAFKSGIKIKRESDNTFSALLPFRKFNRNWYNAMAGASLLANSEIAGGMYIYGRCGGDFTVVCKTLSYKFLRPCFGPAIYRCKSLQDLDTLIKTGGEFNFDIELDVVQQLPTRGLGREIRVGKCAATFHITPKAMHAARAARRASAPTAPSHSTPASLPSPPAA